MKSAHFPLKYCSREVRVCERLLVVVSIETLASVNDVSGRFTHAKGLCEAPSNV